MNELLPKLNELKPITDTNNTFYECDFNDEFSKLEERQKLQVICDIIKATIYPNPFPNPTTEIIEMNGNCHTACEIAMEYLKELKLCKNVKYYMVRKRAFDPEDIVSIHGILIVEGNDDVLYQFDSTPFVGYKNGVVQPLSEPIYEEYAEVNDDMKKHIKLFKEIIYNHKNNIVDITRINKYINLCIDSLCFPILGAYCGNALKVLLEYIEDYSLKLKLEKLVLKLRPYSKVNIEKKAYQKKLLNKQISLWHEELKDLISSGRDLKRQ
ncbi:MAG: hypothetical protein GX951_02400 [Mollicutes bacterium]|nr:hypothetical protein [Mollicutes bacterium]